MINQAIVMDGKKESAIIRSGILQKSLELRKRGIKPCLATVLVGGDPASKIYVSAKQKACKDCEIETQNFHLPSDTSQEELVLLIQKLNKDKAVHATLVQLPLPAHIDKNAIIMTIDPFKDVDGFHHANSGQLLNNTQSLDLGLYPCTPKGCMYLIQKFIGDIRGMDVVVVGASNIVGKPIAAMCINAGATVTICNSKTKNLSSKTLSADVIIVAVGRPNIITKEMVKRGACVIDVGINRLPDGSIVGDIDFHDVKSIAGLITPVPGGVGPLTISFLLENTIIACYNQNIRPLP